MSGDEDHNYFSPGRRRLPDYNVESQPSPAAAAPTNPGDDQTLPALYYRQSQQYPLRPSATSSDPKRPTVTTNSVAANSTHARVLDPFHNPQPEGNSPDPHEFYRRYRDSFRRQNTGSIYGGLDGTGDEGMMSTPATRQPSISARDRANRLESRFTTSPPNAKPSVPPIQTGPRSRQTSLQALVAKFNQSPDEVPRLPNTAATTSNPSSANQSPSGPQPPRSFRNRISTEGMNKSTTSTSRENIVQAASSARRSPGLDTRQETERVRARQTSEPYGNAHISQSTTDLAPHGSQPPSRRLLFGEIDAPSIDPGFGIPGPPRRRGSEGSVQMMDRTRDKEDPEHGSPSSPSAWYRGVTPSLEGIDLSKPVPPRPTGMHRRSHSEMAPVVYSRPPTAPSNTALSPTQEQDTPTSSPQSGTRTSNSRIPVSSWRSSPAPEQPSFSSREAALPAPLNLKTPERPQHRIPRKSPNGPMDLRQRSPQMSALISEPPPVRSPPLRSSRPRQPVSMATTTASRARAAASVHTRPQTDKSGKPLPELGGVDFAARRERIQRAFTTKVKAREIETEKKRASLILEARMQKGLHESASEDVPPVPPVPPREDPPQEEEPEDDRATPKREKERTLTINTGGPDGKRTIKIAEEDSPTLGTAGFMMRPGMLRDDSSDEERSSGQTSSTEETHFDQDPQESYAASSRGGTGPESRHAPSGTGLSGTPLHGMDLGDLESIQIMLQATPMSEASESAFHFGIDEQMQPRPSATGSTFTDASRGSAPASGSTTQGPWSPKSNSTLTTAPSHHENDHPSMPHSTEQESSSVARHEPIHHPVRLDKSLPSAPDASASRGQSVDSLQTPAITNLKRASASLNDPDDWANTSPSMLDWLHLQALDTPVEERSEYKFPVTRGSRQSTSGSPMLPDIRRTGGLGIEIHHGQYTASPPVTGGTEPPAPQDEYQDDFEPALRTVDSGLSVDSVPSRATLAPTSSETPSRPSSEDVPQRLQQRQRTTTESSSTEQPSIDQSSVSITESSKSSVDPTEQKRLTRRRNILKELVDTELSFGQDMTVVVDIYKGTSNVILNSTEDVKVLFGNAAEIVQFSVAFLDTLKQASKSVYVLPKPKRWKNKRDSTATTDSGQTDDRMSVSGDLTDEDRDRMTTIGTAFDKHMTQMEKVYTEYLKNHDAANQRLGQLQKSEKVKIWLKECRAYAHDLTAAWDLDSLLVKPVQRILKYPLLLKELLEVTPENHPDFVALDTAAREMVGLSKRINEAKRRADLVEQVNSATTVIGKQSKKKDTEGRLQLSKAFGRRGDKVKQPIITSENVQDRAYNAVADKFGSHFFQLQVVMRDVEMYVADVQNWVGKLNEFVAAIEGYMDVGQTGYTEIESKWRRFRQSMREMQLTALADHVAAVRKHVIDPMTTLLKLHDGPQRLMDKRKKRIGEYAKYKAIRDRGEKPDKKTTEQGEQFIAVNDTLKDELPKLFALTGKLVEACLQNFTQLQMQWLNVWKAKLRQGIECSQLPESFAVIYDQFTGDFRYTEAQVLSLGLCNGSLLADTANFVNFLSPDRSTVSSATLADSESSRRPSFATDESHSRTTSMTAYDVARARGLSVGSGYSPAYPSPDFGRAADGSAHPTPYPAPPISATTGLPPNSGRRVRASSTASRSPATPDAPGNAPGYRNYTHPPTSQPPTSQPHYTGRRPSTGTGRGGYDSVVSRPSYDGGAPYHSDRLHPDSYAGYRDAGPPSGGSGGSQQQPLPQRASGVFSSALPMSDSPREPSPGNEVPPFDPANINVLFLAASVYEFNIDRARREAGYPYLTYVAGEIFDVIGEKGELWLAKNQDDSTNQIGWIWNKHFAKLAS